MSWLLVIACIALAVLAGWFAFSLRNCRRELADESARLRDRCSEIERNLSAEQDRMLDALSDAFLLIDSKSNVCFVNREARQLFRGRDLMARSLDEVFLDERLASPVRDAIGLGANVTRELILPQQASPRGHEERRGETSWLIDAGPVDHDRPGEMTRVIIRDMTAEHQTEQVRKDFVANASHELRTPLAIINGYLENLLEDGMIDDPATARRFLGVMQKHGLRIARIVEDMLVISRLESGEAANLKIEPFVFGECVDDVLHRLEPVISAQGARVKVNAPDPGILVEADRFYWTQVLFNLVENSLKQNPRITLKIELGFRRTPKGKLKVWVSDNGVGIPAADLPYIFKRFYRVEKHHSQEEIKGTGLGLSIVKRAVEAHGGEIKATSTPGRKTSFEMTLPPSTMVDTETENTDPDSDPAPGA
jgi:two-component system phosphate regulon sensor histidine kinase PhoR